ncbi:MAG: hypothetical protein PHT54_00085 [Candidatus Nanoarchaeia archaeon]|nr:hypothetical protein [Candidatus Nanoarchaeia archaeon]
MKKQGFDEDKTRRILKEEGFSPLDIAEAITQMNIKTGVEYQDFSPTEKMNQQNRSYQTNANNQPGMQSSMLDQDIPVPTPEPPQEIPQYTNQPQSFSYPQVQQQPVAMDTSNEELIESLIEEKWQQVIQGIGDIDVWKARVKDDLLSVKQEIVRITNRFDSLQAAVLSKVNEYSSTLSEVSSDIKALEKVMERIIEPLTTNIKELDRITDELKKNYKK